MYVYPHLLIARAATTGGSILLVQFSKLSIGFPFFSNCSNPVLQALDRIESYVFSASMKNFESSDQKRQAFFSLLTRVQLNMQVIVSPSWMLYLCLVFSSHLHGSNPPVVVAQTVT